MPEIKPATIKMMTKGLLKFIRNSVRAVCFFPRASSFGP